MSNLLDTASDVLDQGFLLFCCNGTCHDGAVREKVCVLGSQQNAMLMCGVAERPRVMFEWVLFGKWWCIAPLFCHMTFHGLCLRDRFLGRGLCDLETYHANKGN